MNLMEELRGLDPRDPGRWPFAVRALAAAVCFVIVALALVYFFVWQDRMPDLQRREDQEQVLRNEFRTKHAKAVNLQVYKQQLADIEKSFGALLRQLPSKTEVPNLLVDISQTGLAAALPRIVTLHDITITPIDKTGGFDQLQLDVTAKTYRYLDDDELAAAEADRKKADDAKRHGS